MAGNAPLAGIPDAEELEEVWQHEWRQAVLREAMRELAENPKFDPRTIRAFERVAFEEKPPAEVAAEVGMTVNEVYVAKSRVLQRLQRIMAELEENW